MKNMRQNFIYTNIMFNTIFNKERHVAATLIKKEGNNRNVLPLDSVANGHIPASSCYWMCLIG
jgi:hypothetical protein